MTVFGTNLNQKRGATHPKNAIHERTLLLLRPSLTSCTSCLAPRWQSRLCRGADSHTGVAQGSQKSDPSNYSNYSNVTNKSHARQRVSQVCRAFQMAFDSRRIQYCRSEFLRSAQDARMGFFPCADCLNSSIRTLTLFSLPSLHPL